MDKKELDPSVFKVLRGMQAVRDQARSKQTLKWFVGGVFAALLAGGFRSVVGQCETEFYQGLFTWPMWVHAGTAGLYATRLFFRGAFALLD